MAPIAPVAVTPNRRCCPRTVSIAQKEGEDLGDVDHTCSDDG